MHKVHINPGAIRHVLYGCAYPLARVDYLPVDTHTSLQQLTHKIGLRLSLRYAFLLISS